MTIPHLPHTDSLVSPDEFRESEVAGTEVQLASENGPLKAFKVLGHGATPAGVSVAWVQFDTDNVSSPFSDQNHMIREFMTIKQGGRTKRVSLI